MPLANGTRLGPYEITAAIGAGGMGEVYRARDTRLDRCVAIKILPSHLSCNVELKNRFEREAKTLSSVTHAHICHLYDVGSQAGVEFLVMELLEGETLASRLQRGALPLPELLKIGVQIADALARAHRLGITHRDLKPANIMLTKGGAKLMDFGLAKPAGVSPIATASSSEAMTATLQSPATPISTVGMVVGTIQYMSPEQIEGKEADARSDIFALGAVLYEMAAGRRAFEGKSQLSVISAILHQDPKPIATTQPAASPSLDFVIRTCLAKDPDERFQTAQDVKLQLNWLLQSGSVASQPSAPLASRRQTSVIIGLAAALVVALGFLFFKMANSRPAASTLATTRFNMVLPPGQDLSVDTTQALTLSPDGKRLAYVAAESGVPHLYVRRLDQFASVEIPDSEGVTFPFFSPKGDWIAFFSQGKLKKAPTDGGNSSLICELPTFFGGTWTPQDIVVVAVPNYGLATVPAGGGALQKVPMLTKERFDAEGPAWFAGGEWIGFTDYYGATRRIMAVNLTSGEVRMLLNNAQGASFGSDHLVYYWAGAMWTVPFDAHKVAVLGSATQMTSGVTEDNFVGQASASGNGVLAYAPGPIGNFLRNLYLVNRSGVEQKLDIPPAGYIDPAVSPDGKRIAIALQGMNSQQLAVYDRDRGVLMRVVATTGSLSNAPVWTPDGKDLLFDSVGASQRRGIYRVAADGSSPPQLVHETTISSHVTSVAGGHAAVMVNDPVTSADIWLLSLGAQSDMQAFKQTSATERQGTLSPDGRWMAYVSNESGRSEIYVEPVPGPGGRWQISTSGGEQPRWVRNGREIVYRNGTKMMSSAVQILPAFAAAKPVELFDRKFDRGGAVTGYDVTPDGQTFVMTRSEKANPTEIRVVVGWSPGQQAQE